MMNTFILTAATRLAALEGTIITPAITWPRHTCAHCHGTGTTLSGGLWRVSPSSDEFYFLHTNCRDAYKTAHGLRSVEGQLPLTEARPRLARRSSRVPMRRANRSAAL